MSELSENIEAKREERAKLRELEQAATPGTWETDAMGQRDREGAYIAMFGGPNEKPVVLFDTINADGQEIHEESDEDGHYYFEWGPRRRDMELAAAARNALPGLLNEIERLERERDAARANAARLREALETVTRELESTHYYEQKDIDQPRAILAETPAESLEAVRQKAVKLVTEQREDLWRLLIAERSGLSAEKGNLPLEPAHWPDLKRCADNALEAIRAEAGRERAVRELRLVRQRIPKLWSWDDIVNAVTDRAAEIEKEGK